MTEEEIKLIAMDDWALDEWLHKPNGRGKTQRHSARYYLKDWEDEDKPEESPESIWWSVRLSEKQRLAVTMAEWVDGEWRLTDAGTLRLMLAGRIDVSFSCRDYLIDKMWFTDIREGIAQARLAQIRNQ